jgi:hypothetical protein
MDKVYQVFVSSTFSDLQEERKQVSDTLAKAGFIPAGMELFPASDQKQLEFIKRVIDRCDYYVVIVAAKYGSLDGDKSYTEKEFEYALSRHIPVLAFLHKEPGKIASDKSESAPDLINRLELFRERLKSSRVVAFWNDVHDLRTEVLTAVTNAVNLSPGVGWIRGDQAIDPKVLQETERLRIENERLRSRLTDLEGPTITFPDHLAGPEHELVLTMMHDGEEAGKMKASIKDLFTELFEELVQQTYENKIRTSIAGIWAVADGRIRVGDYCPFTLSYGDTKIVRAQLEALGLIELVAKVHEWTMFQNIQRETLTAWAITEKGRRYMADLLAVKRTG